MLPFIPLITNKTIRKALTLKNIETIDKKAIRRTKDPALRDKINLIKKDHDNILRSWTIKSYLPRF